MLEVDKDPHLLERQEPLVLKVQKVTKVHHHKVRLDQQEIKELKEHLQQVMLEQSETKVQKVTKDLHQQGRSDLQAREVVKDHHPSVLSVLLVHKDQKVVKDHRHKVQ